MESFLVLPVAFAIIFHALTSGFTAITQLGLVAKRPRIIYGCNFDEEIFSGVQQKPRSALRRSRNPYLVILHYIYTKRFSFSVFSLFHQQ